MSLVDGPPSQEAPSMKSGGGLFPAYVASDEPHVLPRTPASWAGRDVRLIRPPLDERCDCGYAGGVRCIEPFQIVDDRRASGAVGESKVEQLIVCVDGSTLALRERCVKVIAVTRMEKPDQGVCGPTQIGSKPHPCPSTSSRY